MLQQFVVFICNIYYFLSSPFIRLVNNILFIARSVEIRDKRTAFERNFYFTKLAEVMFRLRNSFKAATK